MLEVLWAIFIFAAIYHWVFKSPKPWPVPVEVSEPPSPPRVYRPKVRIEDKVWALLQRIGFTNKPAPWYNRPHVGTDRQIG